MRTLLPLFALLLPVTEARAGAGLLERMASYQQPNIHVGQLAIHPYYKLAEAGYAVEFASPEGGSAPVDPASRDLSDEANRRFLADPMDCAGLAQGAGPP